jgi:hypothetical protein
MRTTLTIDEDVAEVLKRLRKDGEQSLKGLVNEALRRGLKETESRPKRQKPFRTRAVDIGRCRIGNIENVTEALAVAENESFK